MSPLETKLIGRVYNVVAAPSKKAYGFIATEAGVKLFFHQDDCKGTMPELFDLVTFYVVKEGIQGKLDRAIAVERMAAAVQA